MPPGSERGPRYETPDAAHPQLETEHCREPEQTSGLLVPRQRCRENVERSCVGPSQSVSRVGVRPKKFQRQDGSKCHVLPNVPQSLATTNEDQRSVLAVGLSPGRSNPEADALHRVEASTPIGQNGATDQSEKHQALLHNDHQNGVHQPGPAQPAQQSSLVVWPTSARDLSSTGEAHPRSNRATTTEQTERRQLPGQTNDGSALIKRLCQAFPRSSKGKPRASRSASQASATLRARLRILPIVAVLSVTEITPRASSKLNV